MSAFNPNVPTGLVKLSIDYQNIQNNMQQLDTSFGVNHTPFSTATNNGKHKFVEMPTLASVMPAGAPQEGTLYVNTVSSRRELFYTNDNSGNAWQLTSISDSNYGTFATKPGWTFLPGGLLLQYGERSAASSSSVSVTYPRSFSAPAYSIQITPVIDDNSTIRLSIQSASSNTTGFQTNQTSSSHLLSFLWLAIGPA